LGMVAKTSKQAVPLEPDSAADRLLVWYDRHRRVLPWRALPGASADPYAVWLSEVMLQQTTVAAVKSYFTTFLALWPAVGALAAAPVEDVMRRWAGLGYYSRARNLHACAKLVAAGGGGFPDTEDGLRALPGIGAYTAAAIAAIAFDRRAVVVDGNVERVIVRLNAIETPIRESKLAIKRLADLQTPQARCGDYAQAMMDLGATICTPRRPACVLCPLSEGCRARIEGRQETLPAKSVKAERPVRHGSVFYVRRGDEVLVRTRPDKGLLGGMTEFPGSDWDADGDLEGRAKPLSARYRKALAPVEHGFTHFSLFLTVHAATVAAATNAPGDCRWVVEARLGDEALPTLMRKVAAMGQGVLDS
jgi:A/G-specific adenine glycosylase